MPPFLIVQRGVDDERLFGGVHTAFMGNVSQRNQAFHDVGLFGNQAGGIQKYADHAVPLHAASFLHFAQNGGGNHVARLQFVHKTLAQSVYQFGAGRAGGFGNQCAGHVRRMGHAGGVVLEAVHVAQFGTDAVGKHQAVGRCAVMVGGGEALQMQPAAAACRQYHGLGVHGGELAPLQII